MGSYVNVLVPPCSPPLLPQNLSCMASRKGEVETLGRATSLLQKVGHPFSEVQSHHGHVRGHIWRLSTASTRVLHGSQRDLKHACAWACCLANRVTHGLWLNQASAPDAWEEMGRRGWGCAGCRMVSSSLVPDL